MTVGLVLDFAGGTEQQYKGLRDRIATGRAHAARQAGSHSRTARRRLAGDRRLGQPGGVRALPQRPDRANISGTDLTPPQMRVLHVDDGMPDDGRDPVFVQFVVLPGLERAAFRAMHDGVVPGGARPDGLPFQSMDRGRAACPLSDWTERSRDQYPLVPVLAFLVITLPDGAITYHRPPLSLSAWPRAAPGAVSARYVYSGHPA